MNSTISNLICKILFTLFTCLGFSAHLHAQDGQIPEQYVFYSPSEEHAGFLTFVNEKQFVFTNNDFMILMNSENNLHLDTLSLKDIGLSGLIQYIVPVAKEYISIADLNSYSLIQVRDNKLSIKEKMSARDFKKNGMKYTNYLIFPHGYFGIKNKRSKKGNKETVAFYSRDFKLLHEKTLELGQFSSGNLSNIGIAYPHEISFSDGKILLNQKQYKKYTSFDTNTGKVKIYNLSGLTEGDEAGDIFYDNVKNKYFFARYHAVEGKHRARIFISEINLEDLTNYRLNDTELDLAKIRGGIHNGKLIMIGKFMDEMAYYLVPLSELHKL